MASHDIAQCCTIGIKHAGTPTGSLIKIGNIDAYVAEPPQEKAHKDVAIIYLPDVYGIWQNSKLISDQLAANGYYTVIPDILNGDPCPWPTDRPKTFDLFQWREHGSNNDNPHTVPAVDPLVASTIDYLHRELGIKRIGTVSYCFGAKYAARFMAAGKGIDVGYMAHPSWVDEEELRGVQGPLTIAAAETDEIFTVEKRHRSEEILQEIGIPYQMNLYSGVVHGFAAKGDEKNKAERFAREQAFYQAIAWFDTYLL